MQYRSPLRRLLRRLLRKALSQDPQHVYVFEQVRGPYGTQRTTAAGSDRRSAAQSAGRGTVDRQPRSMLDYPDPGPFRPYAQPRLTVDGQKPGQETTPDDSDLHHIPGSPTIPSKEKAEDLAASRVMRAVTIARPELAAAFPYTGERPAHQLARVLGEDRSRAADIRDGIAVHVSGLEASGERVELDRFRSDLAGLHRSGDAFGPLGAAYHVPAYQLENSRGASREPGRDIGAGDRGIETQGRGIEPLGLQPPGPTGLR